jgi:hypothetical protein
VEVRGAIVAVPLGLPVCCFQKAIKLPTPDNAVVVLLLQRLLRLPIVILVVVMDTTDMSLYTHSSLALDLFVPKASLLALLVVSLVHFLVPVNSPMGLTRPKTRLIHRSKL